MDLEDSDESFAEVLTNSSDNISDVEVCTSAISNSQLHAHCIQKNSYSTQL